MERRTVLLIAGLLVAFASLGGAFCVWAFGPDELEGKLEQVQLGMTTTRVEAIMGKPDSSGSYAGMTTFIWETDRVTACTGFDTYPRDGRVVNKIVLRTPLWDRIRAKLPW